MPFWTFWRVLHIAFVLTLGVVIVLRPQLWVILVLAAMIVSLALAIVIHRREGDLNDERIQRINLRSSAFAFQLLLAAFGVGLLLNRFLDWPSNAFNMTVIYFSVGFLGRDFSEWWYRYGGI